MNKNFYCLTPINRCCNCYLQETYCSYFLSIEEILTWICIGSLILFFYNTIKLCIINGLILLIIYWIYQQTDIFQFLKEFFKTKFHSNNQQISDDNQSLNNTSSNKQESLSTKSLLNTNFDDTSNNDYTKANSNYDDMKNLKRNLPEKKSSHLSKIKNLLNDHSKQTMINVDPSNQLIFNNICQTIEHLHDDILQFKSNSKIISDISLVDQTNLTENLIQKIISNRMNKKSSPSLSDNDNDDYQQLKITETQFQYPRCVTVQPSFAIIPRVPTKSTFIAIDNDEDDDEKSVDNYINTSQHIITTSEQFENIRRKTEEKSDKILISKDSMIYHNEQPNWAYYSLKPDLFSPILQTNLPIIQSDNQHLSLKQTFFSYFYPRSKLNNPAIFHSSSLNASDYIISFSQTKSISKQQNSFWKKTFKQGIYRVRKSRIIISFDDIQQDELMIHHNQNKESLSEISNNSESQVIVT